MCEMENCFKPGPGVCPACALKNRRRLRRQRKQRPESSQGRQDRLFLDKQSPREQLDSWRNRK